MTWTIDWRCKACLETPPVADRFRYRPLTPPYRSESAGFALSEWMAQRLTHLAHGYADTVGDDSPWLWCLGGPEVLASPDPSTTAADPCIDANLDVCDEHQVVELTIDLHQLHEFVTNSAHAQGPRPAPVEYASIDDIKQQIQRFLDTTLVPRDSLRSPGP